ncbi:MAG TPA: dienelactone hydrolase family protein [Candidatus Limnocylindrales bacterium]|nr:dienelactone hydrolase family protein [Candidatus Limnocylindrales bacterium]
MNRIIVLLGTLFAITASAQDWAKARLEKSPRHLEWVKVKQGDRTLNCFIAFPEVKEKATAVVVIHEIFGLTDWVRGVADQLAEAGYIAIAPDLLSGAAPGGGGTAELGGNDAVRKAISSLPSAQVTADLNAVTEYVTHLPACNGKATVGGFCWGGGQAFRFATNNKDLKAAFVFYGTGPESSEDIARISGPIYGFYGGSDARVSATVPKSTELLKAASKTYQPVVYKDAGHGFMRAGEAPDANAANKDAREEAWKRWKEILKGI